ncbi:ATPase AAA [Pseudomonas amygdali]|uniref:ATPase AAA n=1 Tax=Pseudomonas amygdali TaxID=47877 RepID=UPI0001CC1BD7|nr:ATPase AAA [Pseudomonas amygdali]KWT16113.1 hypothetical protein AL041_01180 [Pseudomonas amygdali pv. aesculi]KWT19332.1 hypothetical protein AL043_04155 [Pseudomonas amygdali pv. aesculi]KWT24526.1 hypothetical protein AL042_18670 [Pseudomonas amygdali pv. aesculi]KWT27068.1 hypothetical protein AL044_19135 [Pseudomonas amygdali pv. aesculi]KWT35194.1 hypothetical protein AL045_26140 [Pseudomonas amygdali pv. aesculi]
MEERYHPEDHVEVRIEKLFRVALHDEGVASEIRNQIAKLCDAISLEKVERILGEKVIPIANNIRDAAKSLERLALDITTDPWRPWPIAECKESATEISRQLSPLWSAKWEAEESKEKPKNGHDQDSSDLEYRLGRISGEADSLLSLLGNQYFDGENSRTILLYGRAGTGKSHLLGSVAQRAVSEGRRAIFILGQHLREGLK